MGLENVPLARGPGIAAVSLHLHRKIQLIRTMRMLTGSETGVVSYDLRARVTSVRSPCDLHQIFLWPAYPLAGQFFGSWQS